ncbi:MAG: hypothetical protein KA533_09305 [Sphingobium sp.]|nr:hypothetical protein [Sphingobium sp.]MBP6112946.1 hypothetical protein [Sphingobium sp.]MBP8672136.1 hypothetical protein [Sphingobium sp.]MBP9158694.1 hypothetical protein [Sphingobium sp.]
MSALDGLLGRAEHLGEVRAARRRRDIAEEANALPGISAHVESDAVILEGRGLLDRWLREASLRNIGRILL